MSKIDLRNFVDINIQPSEPRVVESTREIVVLYTDETKLQENNGVIIVNSLVDAESKGITSETYPNTHAYLSVYFSHGGIKVKVITGVNLSDITNAKLDELDDKEICVMFASTLEKVNDTYTKFKSLAKDRETNIEIYHGINEKLLICNCNTTTATTDTEYVKNFIVKYSTKDIGAEMTIAAYLSKIDVYGINTVEDYAFTKENINSEDLTNDNYKLIFNDNINVDNELAGAVRNLGGNCKDGNDLVNEYVRIILHQTLTDRLINLLTQKIKNSSGISKIYSILSEELQYYLTCGYLTTDKIWLENDYKVSKKDTTYTIIEKGTPLLNGYYITILPMSSLTVDEKAKHLAPSIYIIIADQYGIRKINIEGEVI